MSKDTIVVIEDEEDIQELISYNLTKNGYDVKVFLDAESYLHTASQIKCRCMILDLMLPGIDGLEVCRQIKLDPNLKEIPIIMVTARGEEIDIVTGLESGADDYIVKPFSPRILLSRIRAVLRRVEKSEILEKQGSEIIAIGDIKIIPGKFELYISNELIKLTTSEFKALLFLISHPGWVYTRNQIVEQIHGDDYPVTDRSIDVLIVGLRKKMGGSGSLIETVRGIGYRFKDIVNE